MTFPASLRRPAAAALFAALPLASASLEAHELRIGASAKVPRTDEYTPAFLFREQ